MKDWEKEKIHTCNNNSWQTTSNKNREKIIEFLGILWLRIIWAIRTKHVYLKKQIFTNGYIQYTLYKTNTTFCYKYLVAHSHIFPPSLLTCTPKCKHSINFKMFLSGDVEDMCFCHNVDFTWTFQPEVCDFQNGGFHNSTKWDL